MELLFLLIIAAVTGYLIGRGRPGKNTAGSEANYRARRSWIQRRSGTRRRARKFLAWAAQTDGLPEDFKRWLGQLSNQELRRFVIALDDYTNGLGFDLPALINGKFDGQPELKQNYIEAIAIYGQETRTVQQPPQAIDATFVEADRA